MGFVCASAIMDATSAESIRLQYALKPKTQSFHTIPSSYIFGRPKALRSIPGMDAATENKHDIHMHIPIGEDIMPEAFLMTTLNK